MRAVDVSNIDVIKEIRLRNWARRNYVSPAIRGPHWHPIVLEEMKQRDGELLQAELSGPLGLIPACRMRANPSNADR